MRNIDIQVGKLHITHVQLHAGIRSGNNVFEESFGVINLEFIICYKLDLNVLGLEGLGDGDWFVGIDRVWGVGVIDVLEVGFHVLLRA